MDAIQGRIKHVPSVRGENTFDHKGFWNTLTEDLTKVVGNSTLAEKKAINDRIQAFSARNYVAQKTLRLGGMERDAQRERATKRDSVISTADDPKGLFCGLFNRLGKKNPARTAPASPLKNDRKFNILTKKNYAKLEDFITNSDYPANINSEFNDVIRVGNNLIDPPRVTSKTEKKGDVMTRLELLCGREKKIKHAFFPDGDEAKRQE
jgi:hypothetical protein